MADDDLKTSFEWAAEMPEINIIDADGWDRKNYTFSYYQEQISKSEFLDRVSRSTVLIDQRFAR